MRVDCYRFVRWQLAWPAVLVNAMAQFFFFFFGHIHGMEGEHNFLNRAPKKNMPLWP